MTTLRQGAGFRMMAQALGFALISTVGILPRAVAQKPAAPQGPPVSPGEFRAPPASGAAAGSPGTYTAADIAKRPYSANLPAPLYPSSPRVQKQFKVEYLFNYAESTYTPPAVLPTVARDTKRDTPEAALGVFYSAIRAGDYEGWLSCWDAPTRAQLEAVTKAKPNKAQYWRDNWKSWAGKRFVLLDRLETIAYVVIDVRVEDPTGRAKPEFDQEILVPEEGQWVLTNVLSNDGLVMNHEPGVDKVTKEYDVRPAADLVGPAALTGMAQREFLKRERTQGSVTQTLE